MTPANEFMQTMTLVMRIRIAAFILSALAIIAFLVIWLISHLK